MESKTEISEFPVRQLVTNQYFKGKRVVSFYVTRKNSCYKILSNGKEQVDDLRTVKEEAETRIFLCMFHALRAGFIKYLVHSPNTDVFISWHRRSLHI
jgi:hypothetical protein